MRLDGAAAGQLVRVVGCGAEGAGAGQLTAIGVVPGRVVRVGRRIGSAFVMDVRSARGPWHRVAVARSLASGVVVAPLGVGESDTASVSG